MEGAQFTAHIAWARSDSSSGDSAGDATEFVAGRYSRGHEWTFDGKVVVPASSAPSSVPLPWSVEAAVDPEEAVVAAVSSCHMLFFLAFAAKKKWGIDAYADHPVGVMGKNEQGRFYLSKITLRPHITFIGAAPDPAAVEALHHLAHEHCYIANSLRAEVIIAAPGTPL